MRLTEKMITILESLDLLNKVGLREFSRRVGIKHNTVSYHLKRMEEEGLIIREQGKYAVSDSTLERLIEEEFGGEYTFIVLLRLIHACFKCIEDASQVQMISTGEATKKRSKAEEAIKLAFSILSFTDTMDDAVIEYVNKIFAFQSEGYIELTEKEKVFLRLVRIAEFFPTPPQDFVNDLLLYGLRLLEKKGKL